MLKLKDDLEIYILEEFGERCPDYSPGCYICIVWRAFDILFDFEEE